MNGFNWKSGAPTEEGRFLVKGVAGSDPARIMTAQVRKVARGVVMFLQDIEKTVTQAELRDAFHTRCA